MFTCGILAVFKKKKKVHIGSSDSDGFKRFNCPKPFWRCTWTVYTTMLLRFDTFPLECSEWSDLVSQAQLYCYSINSILILSSNSQFQNLKRRPIQDLYCLTNLKSFHYKIKRFVTSKLISRKRSESIFLYYFFI